MGDEGEDRVRIEAAGTDLDEAAAVFEQGYNGTGLVARATELDFSYRHSATGDPDLTLRTSRFYGEITGTIEPPGEHIVQWLSRGRAVMDLGRDEVQVEVGVPVVFPHGRPFSFRYADFEQNLVHVDDVLLHEVAAEREGAAPGSLRFDHSVPPSPAALGSWNSTVRLIAQTYLGGEIAPMMRAEMARLAAVAMLDTFSHSSTSLPEALLAPRNASLRSAVEYVHAHAHLPITAADVAQHAGLTARGLQQSFSRHLETTPTEYLRGVRLERVHEELRAGSPDRLTVSEVARRWAFAHLGRFSAAYVKRFGEYPRDTLQRP
ncbi:AraC-like DNA-binding protein [Frigoribacterium sp. PvP120]|uniref:helix-turn-helix transcriptional regulator n=1 Tax=unclassified Frigoribacterium TaxID=2627005 RepID=UPI001AE1220D|nr:helix-turn-helix transcriptional regulator [Frigoribacterium sp. PvP121]MBP1240474.1 AraC-like DNA-binding protein [Frigoribacterium sp. PvP121]